VNSEHDFLEHFRRRAAEVPGWLSADELWSLVERRANATPMAPMLVDEAGSRLSFGAYHAACLRVAAGLHARYGIEDGTVVSWELPTWPEAVVLVGALARLGAVQNPIVPIYRSREVGFVVEQCRARMLVVPPRWRDFDYEAMACEIAARRPQSAPLHVLVVERGRGLPEGDPASLPPFVPWRNGAEQSHRTNRGSVSASLGPAGAGASATIDADQPNSPPMRWVFYTSGTTADPKGACHSDVAVLAPALAMCEAFHASAEDAAALVFPFTHIGGIGILAMALISGCRLLSTERFDPATTIPFLAAEGVTLAGSGTPFHLAYLAAQRAQPGTPLFSKVRAFVGGGAPKPPQLHYEMRRELGGVGIVSGYGLTECPILSMASVDDPDDKLAMTEGRAVWGVSVRIVGSDGRVLPAGEVGELRVKAPQLMRGYLDASLDAEAFDEEGWFGSGDLAYLDADGYVVITGRLKDVIIRKGENISAKEVEDLLYEHPKVADVAVVGLPDPATGERACAVVVPEQGVEPPSLDELAAFLRDRGLRVQAIPEQLEIVEALPRNPAGKVVKHELRRRFASTTVDRS
jgi:cyclohexanecarboxylate-CoA ligase